MLKVYPKENGVERPQAANTPFQSIDSVTNEYSVQEYSHQRSVTGSRVEHECMPSAQYPNFIVGIQQRKTTCSKKICLYFYMLNVHIIYHIIKK